GTAGARPARRRTAEARPRRVRRALPGTCMEWRVPRHRTESWIFLAGGGTNDEMIRRAKVEVKRTYFPFVAGLSADGGEARWKTSGMGGGRVGAETDIWARAGVVRADEMKIIGASPGGSRRSRRPHSGQRSAPGR